MQWTNNLSAVFTTDSVRSPVSYLKNKLLQFISIPKRNKYGKCPDILCE